MKKKMPLNCVECGKFLGKDGYPQCTYDEWNGGYECDPVCGQCGRKKGWRDKRSYLVATPTEEREKDDN